MSHTQSSPKIQLFDTSKVILIARTVSSASVSSTESDSDDCVLPFTRSPLDECRGSTEKYGFMIGDVKTKKNKKNKKTHRRSHM
jgi:hypothetical protein